MSPPPFPKFYLRSVPAVGTPLRGGLTTPAKYGSKPAGTESHDCEILDRSRAP
jgi:hypothetical protein